MEEEKLKVSKDTQKFIADLADLPPLKYQQVIHVLQTLEKQQEAEAHLENKRGWRYMWQRTPKPYLLMLGYLVFLAPVGSLGYQAFSNVPENLKIIYLIILIAILLLPLLVVFYLSFNYMKKHVEERENTSSEILQKEISKVIQLEGDDVDKKESGNDYFKSLEKIKEKYPNAYESWKQGDEKVLRTLFSEGKKISEISTILKRQPNAIRIRLKKLNLIND